MISSRAFRAGRGRHAYEQARRARLPRVSVRPVFYDEYLNAVFWVFPGDRKIAGLTAAANGDLSRRDAVPVSWRSTRLMAYAPEKSATLACLDDRGRIVAYVKVTSQDEAERDYRRYQALGDQLDDNSSLRLPRALAYLPSHRVFVIEAIDGRRLHDATGAEALQDATRFGAALARFHQLGASDAPQFTRFSSDRLVEARRLVTWLRPDVEHRIGVLVEELIATHPAELEPPVCLHGDVHSKNAIVTDRGIALIDLEDLATGPAAADIGSFLAALLYLRRGGQLAADRHDRLARAFLVGYESVRPLPAPAGLRWHTAAALLIERILRSVTRVRPLGLFHLPGLLADARALLEGHHDGG